MKYFVSTYIEELDNYNKQLYQHVHENISITKKEQQHRPIPVY